MLCVALSDKLVITVSLFAPTCVCVLQYSNKINHRIQLLCVKGTVTSLFNTPVSLLGGRCVFLHGLTSSRLSSKMFLRHLNESITQQFSREQNNCPTSFLSLSFSFTLSLSHTEMHIHTHTCKRIHTKLYTFRRTQKATLFLSVLMSLGIIKSLP